MKRVSFVRILAAVWMVLLVVCVGLPIAALSAITIYVAAIDLTLADLGRGALVLLAGIIVALLIAGLTVRASEVLRGDDDV